MLIGWHHPVLSILVTKGYEGVVTWECHGNEGLFVDLHTNSKCPSLHDHRVDWYGGEGGGRPTHHLKVPLRL